MKSFAISNRLSICESFMECTDGTFVTPGTRLRFGERINELLWCTSLDVLTNGIASGKDCLRFS
jgi:hypothetical protein